MGLFKIFKGVKQVAEGIIEGDVAKVVKGAVNTTIGVATTLSGGNDNDSNADTESVEVD